MKVEVWSDVVCPWCYLGKRRLEQALSRFADRDQIEVEWKAFELDPNAASASAAAPHEPGDHARGLAAKMGTSPEQAATVLDSMTAMAAAEGLDFRFADVVAANTLEAHQVIHLAKIRGVQAAAKERLMRAYFTEGLAVGDRDVLVGLAAEVGLDPVEVLAALNAGTYLAAVREDEDEAQQLGITGVPFFVVDERYGLAGAQPAEQLLAALEQAWAEHTAAERTAAEQLASNR